MGSKKSCVDTTYTIKLIKASKKQYYFTDGTFRSLYFNIDFLEDDLEGIFTFGGLVMNLEVPAHTKEGHWCIGEIPSDCTLEYFLEIYPELRI